MTLLDRAYSLLETKSIDEEKRIITGVATTISPDRMDDIVESRGAEFKLPIPFLSQHMPDRPIGHVVKAKISDKQIEVEIHIQKIEEPGLLKDRLDMAWQEIKYGLVKGLSIGFKPLEAEPIKGTYGTKFLRWLWLELSAVTVAANGDCSIQQIKSIDTQIRAATGTSDGLDRPVPPGDTGTPPKKPVNLKAKEATMNATEHISALETKQSAIAASLQEIQKKVADEGRTKDDAEKEQTDNLKVELGQVVAEIKDAREIELLMKATAKPVVGTSAEEGSRSRQPGASPIQVKRNVEKGIIFTRLLGAKYLAYKHGISPIEVAKSKFGDTPEVELILRAPIAAMNTTDTTAASPLVELQNATGEFIELLRPQTIIGRIPGLRRVPFNIKVPRGTGDPTAYWVGEGKVKPVSSMAFDQVELTFAKVAGIVTQTEELMRFSQPASEGLVRDGLIAAVAYLVDRDFLDPAKAATDISPASITNGVSPITASGTTADALRADLGALLDEYEDDNAGGDNLVLVMNRKLAGRISLMRNTLGQREFEGLTRQGGTLESIPVVTSNNIVAANGSPADGSLIVAINASSVMLADDGGVEIDISREASLQMDSSPDSPATGSTTLVSLWQHNMVAIRAERFINWKKARDGAVQYINGAKYA